MPVATNIVTQDATVVNITAAEGLVFYNTGSSEAIITAASSSSSFTLFKGQAFTPSFGGATLSDTLTINFGKEGNNELQIAQITT